MRMQLWIAVAGLLWSLQSQAQVPNLMVLQCDMKPTGASSTDSPFPLALNVDLDQKTANGHPVFINETTISVEASDKQNLIINRYTGQAIMLDKNRELVGKGMCTKAPKRQF